VTDTDVSAVVVLPLFETIPIDSVLAMQIEWECDGRCTCRQLMCELIDGCGWAARKRWATQTQWYSSSAACSARFAYYQGVAPSAPPPPPQPPPPPPPVQSYPQRRRSLHRVYTCSV
jgi:hypothetical protein